MSSTCCVHLLLWDIACVTTIYETNRLPPYRRDRCHRNGCLSVRAVLNLSRELAAPKVCSISFASTIEQDAGFVLVEPCAGNKNQDDLEGSGEPASDEEEMAETLVPSAAKVGFVLLAADKYIRIYTPEGIVTAERTALHRVSLPTPIFPAAPLQPSTLAMSGVVSLAQNYTIQVCITVGQL